MKVFLSLAAFALATTAHATEPWADRELPVTEGLALWLDAGAEPVAASMGGAKFEKDQVPRGVWHDASGKKRDARQGDDAAQPKFAPAYPAKVFSFDGRAQHFAVGMKAGVVREATVFVFARVRSNAGGFRGLVAAGADDANDYESGFNLDLGSAASDGVTCLNGEGAGFGGERNLLQQPVELGRAFAAAMVIGASEVMLYRGTQPQGARPRTGQRGLRLDRLLIGGRHYDHSGGVPIPRGILDGDIFEVLLYDRALAPEEVARVAKYLETKYAGLVFIAPTKATQVAGSVPLVAVKDPPVIQPLVPGFTARKLPVALSNSNVLRYREDGRLFVGAYDGKIWLLRDTNGDGLEDAATLYFERDDVKASMGMALTPPGYARGEGVFLSTRGKVLLVLDKDHDGKSDEVVTVADGWEPPRRMGGGVSDALALAVAPDGRVFFNLGATDFTNAYLLDAATGQARFRVESERGTVQEVSADFQKRTTYASGVRFLVGLAFNRHGDLFGTEQEGATWLANGNPFDELLHLQPGRYYGFPPRHPQHLPEVIDEPSTFDYGPQHQSTVGLAFNEPVRSGGQAFGPEGWRGDALVAAMSRGKIYRTKLVKTPAGYVAKNETFAQLQRIVIDQAVTPRGALTVCLHSGAPDWGTGPTGAGELWQITPIAKELPPQPTLAWSASSTELRVAFDQPLNAAALAAMQGKVSVTQGRYVQAGDRFETMRPGYQVVKNQLSAPRYPIGVRKISLSEDGRTLLISTGARTAAVNYGINISADAFGTKGEGAYAGQIDLLADLTGIETEWKPARGSAQTSVLPHPDFTVSRALTAQSAEHRAFWDAVTSEGTVTLRGQLDLGLMLYPAVQEGSKLDWDYPEERVTLVLSAARPFTARLGSASSTSAADGARYEARLSANTKAGTWLPFTLELEKGSGDPGLQVSWVTDRSDTPRPLGLHRALLPYAQQQDIPPAPKNDDLPQLIGGNWNNGQMLYKSLCAVCHTMRGEGAKVGPDLTNLIYRDYDSVLRDIREPNAAINPEHVGYTIKKRDGSEITAVWISENADSVSYALPGQTFDIPRADIVERKQLAISLMPAGLDQALSPAQLRDLMSYLLLPPLEAAPIVLPNAPPPRKLTEVEAILGKHLTSPMDSDAKPLRIVLCASEKDKGHVKPGLHDYPLWRSRWTRLLSLAPGLTVEPATDWPSAKQWSSADVIVFNTYNPAWALEKDDQAITARGAEMDTFLARGGGLVVIHYALNAGRHADALAKRLGLAWRIPPAKYRHGANDWSLDKNHPLAAGFTDFKIPDESYWHMTGDLAAARASVLATSLEESAATPQMWTRETGPGRVFVSVPGHFTWTHDDPLYRLLILRGMMWTAKQPIDRLTPLSVVGARVEH